MFLSFQIFIIPGQYLLNLADVHCMVVALGIMLVEGILTEESAFLQLRLKDLLANQYQLRLFKPIFYSTYNSMNWSIT